ncbi:glycosyltransferase [Flagellimonas allohymeniacidonis]|uniref:Glycosyltransferase n=1 Tax=Flagellimonas allohymeniacidonis TaxID=2517819 RepID=A0A4Q8QM90_9FLAO|nr:glycosyltransferase [Allomuricauda hymeniacidonis]TAI49719.1 glycosyltransferase [Allomuricauda hymeniacidonis]
MRIGIIIPAHNEGPHLAQCLDSFVNQTIKPDELIVVDDNSSDDTHQIAVEYSQKNLWIKVVKRKSSDAHIPGTKVVQAFNYGLEQLSETDLIGKFDADIVLPANYFETMVQHFQANWKLGMCGGLLHVKKNNHWEYENIADKSHIRGPIKLYHKTCFAKIEGLRSGVGWDTVDVLLAKFHDFETYVDPSLHVKHLRPTGMGYSLKKAHAKGEAFYRMRYGIALSKIAAFKMALNAKSPKLYFQIIWGYFKTLRQGTPRFVTSEEGAFIRKYRWKRIFSKLFKA